MGFVMLDGFLFKGSQLCIPDCNLQIKIINELHGGHIDRDRMLQLVLPITGQQCARRLHD